MVNIVEKFSKYLSQIEYPKEKTSWNIAGIIRGQNAFYKFDVREMGKLSDGTLFQKGRTDTKADKIVLELKNRWTIFDIEELHKLLKSNKLNKVNVDFLLSKLEWTIFIPKKS